MIRGNISVTFSKGVLGSQPEAEMQIDVSSSSASSFTESCSLCDKESRLGTNCKSSPSQESLLRILPERAA